MFTGIISHLGKFSSFRKSQTELLIEAPPEILLERGDSLAINGVCLSLVWRDDKLLVFNLSKETLQTTNLRHLRRGQTLNLELPLSLSTPLGGHLVSGHVDTTEKVLALRKHPAGWRMSVSLKSEVRPFFILKGSVAVNGVSLTIASLGGASMDLELIPLTLEGTNLDSLRSGDAVNIECDIIGKYVYNMVLRGRPGGPPGPR